MTKEPIDKKYDTEIEKAKAEMEAKISAIENERESAKSDIETSNNKMKVASGLWELGHSSEQISHILHIPNDKELKRIIRGTKAPDYRELVKSHESNNSDYRQGGDLHHLHETYPCPICHPKQNLTRQEELDDYKMWLSRVRKSQARAGTFDKANEIRMSKERELNDTPAIEVIEKNIKPTLDDSIVTMKNDTQRERIIERLSPEESYVGVATGFSRKRWYPVQEWTLHKLKRLQSEYLQFIKALKGVPLSTATRPTLEEYQRKQRLLNTITHELRKRYRNSGNNI